MYLFVQLLSFLFKHKMEAILQFETIKKLKTEVFPETSCPNSKLASDLGNFGEGMFMYFFKKYDNSFVPILLTSLVLNGITYKHMIV